MSQNWRFWQGFVFQCLRKYLFMGIPAFLLSFLVGPSSWLKTGLLSLWWLVCVPPLYLVVAYVLYRRRKHLALDVDEDLSDWQRGRNAADLGTKW